MEAAAIAWVAGLYRVPFLALKSITNLLDHSGTSEAQFLQNLDLAVASLTGKLLEALRFLDGKSLEELKA
jgi:nucleoside phosphorylase